jgi:anaerobic dimethyl sulfoxide reductase subunit B (iron-sulfur subunit)
MIREMSYTFTFDASACSGCKTCQEACKDKNNLPIGIMWRRVIEISGGDWHMASSAWENSVFAYNLSLACNHCTHPKCAGVCPVDAYTVRPDGIVLIDSSKCMGCDYCAWACPYGAPQYDNEQGIMTKCDFCYDRLDAGMLPSCVAACPLRVLDYETIEELSTVNKGQNLWQLPATEHPFPLPDYSRTEPHLAIKPHAGMNNPLTKTVSNQEELRPPHSSDNTHRIDAVRELPLVGFTLLAQAAAGMAVFSLVLSPVPLSVLLAIGILLGVGGLISFLHLGRKGNAWRSVMHLKKSWLSREILVAGLFGATWAVAAGLQFFWGITPNPWPLAILGLGLIYSMTQVYHFRAVPAWNNWRTSAAFFLSAVTLGALGVNIAAPHPEWVILAGIGMIAGILMMLTAQSTHNGTAGKLRIAFLGLGIIGALFLAVIPQANQAWLAIPIFLVVMAAEIIGRWQFFALRKPFPMNANHARTDSIYKAQSSRG